MNVQVLVNRPMGLITFTLALALAGAFLVNYLHTSLLPEQPLPFLEIRLSSIDRDAAGIEQTIAAPLRAAFAPIQGVISMESTCKSGEWILKLHFSRDTDMELARQQVSDRMDQALESDLSLPNRPEIRLPVLADIPVMYVYLRYKNPLTPEAYAESMGTLSDWASEWVSQRMEQQPDVGTVEISGLWEYKWEITPLAEALQIRGIDPTDLPMLIQASTSDQVQLTLSEGYRSRPVSILYAPSPSPDSLLLRQGSQAFFLKEVALIRKKTAPAQHEVFLDQKPAICFSILQRPGTDLLGMKQRVTSLCNELAARNPNTEFVITQDQSEILDASIRNMWQGLAVSMFLAMLLYFIFMRQGIISLLISLVVGVGLCWTFGAFWVLGIGINSLSLAGMVIGIGLMVDNAIIMVNQIRQYLDADLPLKAAVTQSVSDLALPLISSSATTLVVFVPLSASGDVVSALFSEQAWSMSLSLIASFFVSLLVIPPVYYLLARRFPLMQERPPARFWLYFQQRYQRTLQGLLKRWQLSVILPAAILIIGACSLAWMPRQLFPPLARKQLLVRFYWPKATPPEVMKRGMTACIAQKEEGIVHTALRVGEQPFIRDPDPLQTDESELFIECTDSKTASLLAARLDSFLLKEKLVPRWRISPMPTPFEYVFTAVSGISDLRAYLPDGQFFLSPPAVDSLRETLSQKLNVPLSTDAPLRGYMILPDAEKLISADLSTEAFSRQLKWHLQAPFEAKWAGSTQVVNIESRSDRVDSTRLAAIPITLPGGSQVPLRALARVQAFSQTQAVFADKNGVFVPLYLPEVLPPDDQINTRLDAENARISGLYLSYDPAQERTDNQIGKLSATILWVVVLLYLILAAQFESFLIPLVVLLEIPVVLAGTLIIFYVCGQSLNLMALIGLITTMGITINDSILKLDTIQRKIKEGLSLENAILKGSSDKLSSVILTSLTTTASTLPFLFAADLGSQLQRPFAFALGAGIVLGLLVSMYLVPVWMYLLNKKSAKL